MKDKMIKQLKELEKEIEESNKSGDIDGQRYAFCNGLLMQLKSDIKIRIEELGEIIEFLEKIVGCHEGYNGCQKIVRDKIKELKQKKKELEETLK